MKFSGGSAVKWFTAVLVGAIFSDIGPPGGRFKNAYEHVRAFKFSTSYKMTVFQCMGKMCCVEFQRFPCTLYWNSAFMMVLLYGYSLFILYWVVQGCFLCNTMANNLQMIFFNSISLKRKSVQNFIEICSYGSNWGSIGTGVKVPFEIPHKLPCTYIERFGFYTKLKF